MMAYCLKIAIKTIEEIYHWNIILTAIFNVVVFKLSVSDAG
jgi:hypothetical protein